MEFLYFGIALVVLFVIYMAFNFFSMKKQQKRFVEIQEQLKPNTNVVIAGGIYGRIKHLDKQYAKIEIAENVVIKVERYAIKAVEEQK